MEHLCSSFWFWFVVLTSFLVATAALGFSGYYLGLSIGRRVECAEWTRRTQQLHDRYQAGGRAAPETRSADPAQPEVE